MPCNNASAQYLYRAVPLLYPARPLPVLRCTCTATGMPLCVTPPEQFCNCSRAVLQGVQRCNRLRQRSCGTPFTLYRTPPYLFRTYAPELRIRYRDGYRAKVCGNVQTAVPAGGPGYCVRLWWDRYRAHNAAF